jgi:hypothetical protein
MPGAQAGWAGEHGAAGVLGVLVERVGGQRLLEPDELGRVLMNAMKNMPPNSVPACGSMPSVKE